jgi:GT2 family glycosyltransferase
MQVFSFVILHYQTAEDTISCVRSIIENISYPDKYILVVENGSSNKSGELVKNAFLNLPWFIYLHNNKNLGFAKGNNVGYSYAKNVLKSDFIALINNDTSINQADFVDKIIERYNQNKFHLLGPDIISLKDGGHQNPRIEILTDILTIRKFIRNTRIMYLLALINMDLHIERLKKAIIPGSKLRSSTASSNIKFDEEIEDVKLHGSALIYSPDFISKYDFGFYPETFIYNEESILHYIVRRDKLKAIYFPEVKIFHKEDSATDSVYRKKYRKRLFYYKNFIRSSRVLIKLMKQEKIT